GRGCLDLFPDQAFYGATRCNVTAVQKYRPDDGLDRVRKQSMLFSAACFLFTAADAQELTDLDRLARIRECRGRDEMMLHQRQVALIKRRMKSQKTLGDGKRHDGIAKEFEHLVL